MTMTWKSLCSDSTAAKPECNYAWILRITGVAYTQVRRILNHDVFCQRQFQLGTKPLTWRSCQPSVVLWMTAIMA